MRKPSEVKAFVLQISSEFYGTSLMTAGNRGAITGILNDACGSDGRRHMLLEYLFGVKSSKELNGSQWVALARWINAMKAGTEYLPQLDFTHEVDAIMNEITGTSQPRLDDNVFTCD